MGSSVSETTGQRLTNMKETDKAYIAGYMDGEGCFRFHHSSPEAGVKSCNPYPMQMIVGFFGGNICKLSKKTNRGKTVYQLRYYGEKAINFIKTIDKYLIEKKDQADAMIQLHELNIKLKQAKRKDHHEH
jgi:hypothetical protein